MGARRDHFPDLDGRRPIAGYARVSRVGGRSGESYISPTVQREALERWAEGHGTDLAMYPPEENVSGGGMERPVLDRILAGIRSGELAGIAVYRLDRFARNLSEGAPLIREIAEEHDAEFAALDYPNLDTLSADGRLMLHMRLAMAEHERDVAAERWETALTYAVARGVHISPVVPYGYVKDPATKILVPGPEGAPHVVRAYEMRAGGATWQAVADHLNAHAPARDDGRSWLPVTVERMVRRRVYLGVAHWGDVENADAHEPIVDADLWRRAQRSVQGRSKKRKGESALLHGVVRCAGCGFQMSAALNTSGERRRRYYRCRVHRVSGTCPAPASVRADGDDGLEAAVDRLVADAFAERGEAYMGLADSSELDDALRDLAAAEEALDAFRIDAEARSMLGSRWRSFLEPMLAAVEQAEARVAALREEVDIAAAVEGLTADAYLALPREERAEVIRETVDVVYVRSVGGPRGRNAVALDGDRVRVLWRGSGPDELPPSNRAGELRPWAWPEAA